MTFCHQKKRLSAILFSPDVLQFRTKKIEPLDGDIYSSDEEVIWSKEWKNEKEGVQNGLTVLATADWASLSKQL